jgi:hypothetical protein
MQDRCQSPIALARQPSTLFVAVLCTQSMPLTRGPLRFPTIPAPVAPTTVGGTKH